MSEEPQCYRMVFFLEGDMRIASVVCDTESESAQLISQNTEWSVNTPLGKAYFKSERVLVMEVQKVD